MIRILAGEKKGHLLHVGRTDAVRPTTANVRQVLFGILAEQIAESHWLDLYAGSGVVGLEALSRGAAEAVLVECGHRCVAAIRDSIERLGYRGRCRLVAARVEKGLRQLAAEGRTFDVIFVDPPYRSDEVPRCLLALGTPPASSLLRSPDSLVIVRVHWRTELRPVYGALALDRERKIGDGRLVFYRAARENPAGESSKQCAEADGQLTDTSGNRFESPGL